MQATLAPELGRVLLAQVLLAVRHLQGAVCGDDGVQISHADGGRAVGGRSRQVRQQKNLDLTVIAI